MASSQYHDIVRVTVPQSYDNYTYDFLLTEMSVTEVLWLCLGADVVASRVGWAGGR